MVDNSYQCTSRSTVELIRLVVFASDRNALAELLDGRRPFYHGGKHIRLAEFLWQLRQGELQRRGSKKTIDEVTENTYDLTLSKFSDLPLTKLDSEIQSESNEKLKQKQTDCRNYYRVVLERMGQWRTENPTATSLDEELAVSELMQRLVVRHFYLSRLEELRRMRPFATRYAWKVSGSTISLWYPTEMPVKVFREWLENQAPNAAHEPNQLRSRLQSEIDSHLFRNRFISIDELADKEDVSGDSGAGYDPAAAAFPSLVARVVAREKVNNINEQRPAIRDLGRKTLEQLILRVFSDLADGSFKDGSIANDFELSKATFSRFAGSQWRERAKRRDSVAIPDLWRNTAKVIAADPVFLETAQEAGFSAVLGQVLNPDARKTVDE